MEYFETHPTILVGVQSFGKTFTEIYTPTFFSIPVTEEILNVQITNPEELHGTDKVKEKKESPDKLS